MSEETAPEKKIEEVVPEAEKSNPAPEHVPDPVPSHANPDSDLRTIVTGLQTQIAELTSQVVNLATLVPVERDVSPGKRPWTHRGGRH
jgi:hypothetical protein